MNIVVIGGSGLIGKKLVKLLGERGHEVVAASPSTGVNAVTGEGLTEALTGARVVVDVANAPSWEDAAVMAFFDTSTRNLLAAEPAAAGLVVPIVGGVTLRGRAIVRSLRWVLGNRSPKPAIWKPQSGVPSRRTLP
jgi:uncharacterized protein YbjT (DUF2867 family)